MSSTTRISLYPTTIDIDIDIDIDEADRLAIAEGVPDAEVMIADLVRGHEAVARTVRSMFATVDAAHDESTADLLTQRLQVHEKTAWMLCSMLSQPKGLAEARVLR